MVLSYQGAIDIDKNCFVLRKVQILVLGFTDGCKYINNEVGKIVDEFHFC